MGLGAKISNVLSGHKNNETGVNDTTTGMTGTNTADYSTGTNTAEYGEGVGTMGTAAGTGAGTGGVMGVDETETRTTTTTTTERVGEGVCDRQTFTTMEDRPVVKEQKVYTKEHHPYEKQYAVETKFVGERYVGGGNVEALGVEERVVEQATPAPPCADAPQIGQQALAGARNNPTY